VLTDSVLYGFSGFAVIRVRDLVCLY